jgi:hypothetical protein
MFGLVIKSEKQIEKELNLYTEIPKRLTVIPVVLVIGICTSPIWSIPLWDNHYSKGIAGYAPIGGNIPDGGMGGRGGSIQTGGSTNNKGGSVNVGGNLGKGGMGIAGIPKG